MESDNDIFQDLESFRKDRASAMSQKSGKCQGNPLPHKIVKELSGKFNPLQCQGNVREI